MHAGTTPMFIAGKAEAVLALAEWVASASLYPSKDDDVSKLITDGMAEGIQKKGFNISELSIFFEIMQIQLASRLNDNEKIKQIFLATFQPFVPKSQVRFGPDIVLDRKSVDYIRSFDVEVHGDAMRVLEFGASMYREARDLTDKLRVAKYRNSPQMEMDDAVRRLLRNCPPYPSNEFLVFGHLWAVMYEKIPRDGFLTTRKEILRREYIINECQPRASMYPPITQRRNKTK